MTKGHNIRQIINQSETPGDTKVGVMNSIISGSWTTTPAAPKKCFLVLRNRSSIVTTGPLCRGRCLWHYGKSSENWHWPAWNPLNYSPLVASSRLRAPHSQLHIKSSRLAGHGGNRQHAKFPLFSWHILLNYHFWSRFCIFSVTDFDLPAPSVVLENARQLNVASLSFTYMARDVAWSLAT